MKIFRLRLYYFLVNAAYRDFIVFMTFSDKPSFRKRKRSQFLLKIAQKIWYKKIPITFLNFEDKFYTDYENDSKNIGRFYNV